MNKLKHKQPNYRYGLNKKTRYIMKQGAVILLSISLIGGYVRSRTNNQSFITSNHLEANAWDEHSGEYSSTSDNDGLGGEGDQVKEEVGVIQVVVPTPTPTTPPSPTTQRQEIENYVREVFGEYADEAFKLLECENKNLNPRAINDNTEWGGLGVDRGIFQINSYYHPLTDEQAFDYKQNIDYAWRMFENDNYTFVRWTCNHILN